MTVEPEIAGRKDLVGSSTLKKFENFSIIIEKRIQGTVHL